MKFFSALAPCVVLFCSMMFVSLALNPNRCPKTGKSLARVRRAPTPTPRPQVYAGYCPQTASGPQWEDTGLGSCLLFDTTAEVTAATAMLNCRKKGGYLATLHNLDEIEFIKETTIHYEKNFWIGLTRGGADGTWEWADGTSPYEWNNWHPGEPNNLGDDENCVELRKDTGRWNDQTCTTTGYYICSAPKNSNTCFLQQFGDCKPGRDDLDMNMCIAEGEGGCSCCAQSCEVNPACAGFTWHENEPSCEKPNSGRCRLKSAGCKSWELVDTAGAYWFPKASRDSLSGSEAVECIKAADLVLRKAKPGEEDDTGLKILLPGMRNNHKASDGDTIASSELFEVKTNIDIHAGPSHSAPVIGTLAEGAKVNVACQLEGYANEGGYNVWDLLSSGGYVSDEHMRTGAWGFSPNLRRCDAHDVNS